MTRATPAFRASDLRILDAVAEARAVDGAHGWLIAETLQRRSGRLPGHGTLYTALARLVRLGLLVRIDEDPSSAAREARPPRRLYSVSPSGRDALTTRERGRVPFAAAAGALR